MFVLHSLEELADIRVEEQRKQSDRARFLRTLPRQEGVMRRGMRAFSRLLRSNSTTPKARYYRPDVLTSQPHSDI